MSSTVPSIFRVSIGVAMAAIIVHMLGYEVWMSGSKMQLEKNNELASHCARALNDAITTHTLEVKQLKCKHATELKECEDARQIRSRFEARERRLLQLVMLLLIGNVVTVCWLRFSPRKLLVRLSPS